MIVWHVTTMKKMKKYLKNGGIKPPVRAWKDVRCAEKFSVQTGRKIILRLKVKDDIDILKGHDGNAIVMYEKLELNGY